MSFLLNWVLYYFTEFLFYLTEFSWVSALLNWTFALLNWLFSWFSASCNWLLPPRNTFKLKYWLFQHGAWQISNEMNHSFIKNLSFVDFQHITKEKDKSLASTWEHVEQLPDKISRRALLDMLFHSKSHFHLLDPDLYQSHLCSSIIRSKTGVKKHEK